MYRRLLLILCALVTVGYAQTTAVAPATLQTMTPVCTTPVSGTVIPAGMPNGVAMLCVFMVQQLPVPPTPPPPIWTFLAKEGATVTLKAGAVIRIGAKAGTTQWGLPTGTPLAADSFTDPITITAAMIVNGQVTVSIAALKVKDPCVGYYKEVDILQ